MRCQMSRSPKNVKDIKFVYVCVCVCSPSVWPKCVGRPKCVCVCVWPMCVFLGN